MSDFNNNQFGNQSQGQQVNLQKNDSFDQNNFQGQYNQQQFNQQQMNYSYSQPSQDIKYGDGETEYVMTIKDFIIFMLISMIPIYNIIFIIKVCIGPTSRTNKTMTNYMRAALIVALAMFVIMTLLGVIAGIGISAVLNS